MSPPLELIERYLEGGLTPAQEVELETWLRADREHLRIFLREVHLHRGMRELNSVTEMETESSETVEEETETPFSGWRPAAVRVFGRALRRARWTLAGAAIAICVLAFAWYNYFSTDISLVSAGAGGLFLRRDGLERAITRKIKLRSGDGIRTETTARAIIEYGHERTSLEVGSGTSLEIYQNHRTKLVRLYAGTVHGAVARQSLGSRLEFVTSSAHATVVGTDLKLFAGPTRTELEVYSGLVRLTPPDGKGGVQVGAGYIGLIDDSAHITVNPLRPGSGSILCEYWLDLPGATMSDLTNNARFSTAADGQMYRNRLETPHPWSENYGVRVRGYLHPPRTGEYTFWIAGDDAVELWLSPDEQPEAKRRICYAGSFTALDEWEKYPTQRSVPVHLVGGRRYYIEALLKQAGGNDGLAVSWLGPDFPRELLSGRYLSPATEPELQNPKPGR